MCYISITLYSTLSVLLIPSLLSSLSLGGVNFLTVTIGRRHSNHGDANRGNGNYALWMNASGVSIITITIIIIITTTITIIIITAIVIYYYYYYCVYTTVCVGPHCLPAFASASIYVYIDVYTYIYICIHRCVCTYNAVDVYAIMAACGDPLGIKHSRGLRTFKVQQLAVRLISYRILKLNKWG